MLRFNQDIMIGKDTEDEDISFKVADRRKFNADGSVKEGVKLDAAPPSKVEEKAAAPVADVPTHDEPADDLHEQDPHSEIPGADDPASFVNFLSTLVTNAAAALGAVPHPATGKRSLDLETGKYWLDILGMLKDKTAGNLHPEEARLLDALLGDLRMQYVQLVRATEEKLKAQAAAKFSGDEILGKK